MTKTARVIAVATAIVCIVVGLLWLLPGRPEHGGVTNHSEIGGLGVQTERGGMTAPAHSSDSAGTGTATVRVEAVDDGTGHFEQHINVQTDKHGRDASADANSNVRAVAPANGQPAGAAGDDVERPQLEQNMEHDREDMREKRQREHNAAKRED